MSVFCGGSSDISLRVSGMLVLVLLVVVWVCWDFLFGVGLV